MLSTAHPPILVVGATGAQGGAVVRALRSRQMPVRALVRDPGIAGARSLASLGVELVRGDLEDRASLDAAMQGAAGVFSVQLARPDAERLQGQRLVQAALDAGVKTFVHSSVSGTGWRRAAGADAALIASLEREPFAKTYWDAKEAVEETVRTAGFESFTILKPAFMMENFIPPKVKGMFPDLINGKIVTAIRADTPIVMVSADDIGAVSAEAFAAPRRFNRAEIELAGDVLLFPEIAAILSDVSGKTITVHPVSPQAAIASGQSPAYVGSQLWTNAVGYPARPKDMLGIGQSPTTFAMWARKNKAAIVAVSCR